MNSWETVIGAGLVDDPPLFGEVAFSEHATEFVGVPTPGWSDNVIERRWRADRFRRLGRNQYRRSATQSTGPEPEYPAYLIRGNVYQAKPGDDRCDGLRDTCQGCITIDEGQVRVSASRQAKHRRARITPDDVKSAVMKVGRDVPESTPHIDNDPWQANRVDEGGNGMFFDG